MRIKHQKNTKKNKKIILLVIGALLVFSTFGVAAWALQNNSKDGGDSQSVNLDSPSDEEIKAGNSIKENSLNQSSSNTSSDPIPEPTPSEDGTGLTVDAQITSINKSSSTLSIRTLIQQVTSSGRCELTLSGPNGATVSVTSDVQALPNGATCKGFDVPLSDLSTGDWQVTLKYTNDDIKATASQKVAI